MTTTTSASSPLRLTQTVQKGGCAAKVAASELRQLLANVRFPTAPPELLIDGRHFDDASVQKLTPSLALVSTLDFFTPIVDTPKTFGAIAAANALSDVYAMGGRPLTALGILAFPIATLERSVIADVLQGACDVIEKANATLSGGHSIDDDTLKFGLSVSGVVHPEKIWSNTGAKPGDALILTKAIGTGTITAALKRGAVSESDIQPALESMMQLNNVIDFLEPAGLADAVHAATDLTGFGLAGHAMHIALGSGVDLEFDFSKLPILPGALEMLRSGYLTKAHKSNREYAAAIVKTLPSTDTAWNEVAQTMLYDPQTSGGLLLAVETARAESIVRSLLNAFPTTSIVGRVVDTSAKPEIRVGL